ncbi:uncharacterized protein LOC122249032 [Penaeus japonicus]|uniref:uncharacterized protein LOC122249032 n=1 Tax=Penaeus japonicus TaxID=27405 RepID=UPI001C70DCBC|nr:uncharacterized protein LOC122249032 [Penaeus japonicus]XP_042865465.1 uncharacterized protein LOC122249032 [Penaeus japonicus]XP_042865466.1 uncharacterized protein LOC122249032 [Penaeus japonicus]XP_042865467.1 uncharacterized protein LOC122249032 [Penaeus japonicus]
MEDEVFLKVENRDRLLKLSQAIRKEFPFSVSMHNCLLLHALGYASAHDFYELKAHTNTRIIFSKSKGEQDTVTLFCCEGEVDLLMEGLKKTSLIDWARPFFFLHLPVYMSEGIKALVESRVEGQADFQFPDLFLYSKSDDAEDLECPARIRVRHLGERGVRQMHAAWQYNRYVDVNVFLSMAQHPTNVGVYEADAEEDHRIVATSLERAGDKESAVAWVALTFYGTTGMLYTLESHRRRGLARLALRVFSRLQAKRGLVPHALVEAYNDSSRKLFSSLPGWRKVTRTLVVGIGGSLH